MDKEHLYGMKVALEELYYLPLTMVNPPKEFFEMNQKSILRMLTLPHGAKRELDATVIEAIKEKANLVKKINYFELRVLVKKLLSYGTLALQDLYKFKLIHQLIPSQYHECLDNSAVDYNILFHNVVLDREMAMAVLLFPLCAGETSVKQVVDDFMKPYKSEDNKLTIYEKNMLDLYSEHIEKRLETLLSKYKEAQRRAQQRAQRNAQRKTQQRKAKARGQPSQQRGQPLDFAYQASRGRSMRGQPSSTRGQPSNLTQESLTAQMPDQGQPSNYYSRGSVYRRGRGRA